MCQSQKERKRGSEHGYAEIMKCGHDVVWTECGHGGRDVECT